jgi:hypothetical protein
MNGWSSVKKTPSVKTYSADLSMEALSQCYEGVPD